MEKLNLVTATTKQIREHIYSVISEVSGIDVEDLSTNLLIVDDIAPNSIDRITLFMALEDEFGESIPEDEVKDLHSLGELIEYVEQKIRQLRKQ